MTGGKNPTLVFDVTAVASRCGDWWAMEVPEISGLFTQSRRLDRVETMVGDAAVCSATGSAW